MFGSLVTFLSGIYYSVAKEDFREKMSLWKSINDGNGSTQGLMVHSISCWTLRQSCEGRVPLSLSDFPVLESN